MLKEAYKYILGGVAIFAIIAGLSSFDLGDLLSGGPFGFIDRAGHLSIRRSPAGKTLLVSDFREGFAIEYHTETKEKPSNRFINKSGEIAIDGGFEKAFPFNEGLAAVKLNGKFRFIDKTGNTVIANQFDDAHFFFRRSGGNKARQSLGIR